MGVSRVARPRESLRSLGSGRLSIRSPSVVGGTLQVAPYDPWAQADRSASPTDPAPTMQQPNSFARGSKSRPSRVSTTAEPRYYF